MSNKVYQLITDKILAQLESADPSNYKKPWFNLGHDPINLQGKAYRGINRLLLAGDYQHNIFGTFKGWSDNGCQIKKGSKSLPVVLWKFFQDKDTKETTGVMVRYYNVFNADQVTGTFADELIEKQKSKLHNHNPIPQAETLIKSYLHNNLVKTKVSDSAHYSPSTDTIGMPEIGQFTDPLSYYSTYLHEITHSTGSQSRLKRDLTGRFGSQSYAFEELVAELGAAMLCGTIGLTNEPRIDHAQYLKSWLQILKKDSKAIFTAASMAQKASDYIQGIKPYAEQTDQLAEAAE